MPCMTLLLDDLQLTALGAVLRMQDGEQALSLGLTSAIVLIGTKNMSHTHE